MLTARFGVVVASFGASGRIVTGLIEEAGEERS
jgi:hypothetical protein